MEILAWLPLASSLVIVAFAVLVFRRYRLRGGTHLLVWGIGLTMFGIGSLAEAYSTVAWHPAVFRLWYLNGAILNAAWLGQGTVYLLSGQRLPHLLAALTLGYVLATALFLGLSVPLGLTRPLTALLIVFHGIIFALVLQRRWIRRWNPRRLTMVLTGLLVAGTVAVTAMMFQIPLNASAFDTTQTLSAQYRQILPSGATVRKFTPLFNIYGLITLVGGALYSAWLFWRKEIAPQRVVGNILIAFGALALGFASTLVRLGLGDYLYLAELLGAVSMFGGFLLATVKTPATAPGIAPRSAPA